VAAVAAWASAAPGAAAADPAFKDLIVGSPSYTSAAGHLCYSADGTVEVACPASSPFISSGGLLGIGTESPGYPLDVSGTVRATSFIGDGSGLTGVVASTGDRIVSGTTRMVADGATGLISITQAGTNTAYFHPQLGLVTVGVSSTGAIRGKNAFFTDGNGSTGVVKIQGIVNQASESVAEYWGNEATPRWALARDAYNAKLPGLALREFLSNFAIIGSISGGLVFSVNNNSVGSASANEAMRIVSSGYVGIGTSTPSRTLDISGTGVVVRGLGKSIEINTTGGSADVASYGADLYINNSNNQNTYINATKGKVGVGTYLPSATLHVSGTARFTSWTMIGANVSPTEALEVAGSIKASGSIKAALDLARERQAHEAGARTRATAHERTPQQERQKAAREAERGREAWTLGQGMKKPVAGCYGRLTRWKGGGDVVYMALL
jgi:hypothetical protein